ncbi:MAG: NADP-specific glutamate dehydrogenase [Planctomycetota bacterium]|nr:NADP-specific glutamate dehydrogenase [Planctomycetota bacterium]
MSTSTIEQSADRSTFVNEFMHALSERNPGEQEYLQAVEECIVSLEKVVERHPEYKAANILERIVEPERVLQFRVSWMDDQGEVHVNRGYRVQFNGAIGPYKGGLRFHPSVNRSILKFLGFEQVFKNSLTTQPIGGGKGGSDFDPRGRSDAEVMRFCQAFMTELYRFIGPDTDVPAGDIGVGGREIGYLFGQYRKITNTFTGVLTGRDVNWGGSLIRPEATGYGAVYFAADMLGTRDQTLEGMDCLVSGSGNVAQYTTEKVLDLGGRVITMSDSTGYVHDPAGIDREKLAWIMDLKNNRRGRISEYADAHDGVTYHEHDLSAGSSPLWRIPGQVAFPSATQNEIDGDAAAAMVDNGVIAVSEGANMPTTPEGQHCFIEQNVLYGPGKAANAGGVAVSALEMAQGSQRMFWSREEVDRQLKAIMGRIHTASLHAAEAYGVPGNYLHGANIAGFTKVADAMMDQGVI